MPAPGSGPAAAAPVSRGDRRYDSSRPSYNCTDRPSRPLTPRRMNHQPSTNQTRDCLHSPTGRAIGTVSHHTSTHKPFSRPLKIAHVNINSITAANRLDELHHFVHDNDIHILALTETKLDDSIHPSLYRLDNFHAPLTHHRNRHGGGTAIYAHKSLPITQVKPLELDDCEDWIWCKISISKISIMVCCLYLPPNLNANRLQQFTENLSESINLANAYPSTIKIILGDFNAGNNYLKYPHQILESSGITTFDKKLFDTAETLGLSQIIQEPTRITEGRANLRDLIFISNTELLEDSGTLSSFSCIDHFPIFIELHIETSKPETITKTVWDYEKIDSDLFIRNLQQTDWDSIITKDIHDAVLDFTDAILNAARTAIPTKQVRIKHKEKPWVNNELKRNIRKRDMLFKCAKRTQSDTDWYNWKEQRNLVTYLNRRLHSEHIQSEVNKLTENKQNLHKYHQILGNLTGRKYAQPIPPLLKSDGETVSDAKCKAQILNDYFASQTRLDISTGQLPGSTQNQHVPLLDSITVSEREVLSILNSLDPNKSTGPDEIPTKLLKISAILIVEPMTKLFNKSLQQGIFPNSWKTANIKPIFKNKGSPSHPNNYRPISLLCCMSKILEKIVFKYIYNHLSEHQLLTEKQSGYRPGHSTQLQLTYLTHNIYEALDSGHEFTAIFLDISKYFDKIWHDGLLDKCKTDFGLTGTLLTWLRSYLTNRTQKVTLENASSSLQTINAGCPQGSVLGPLLALMYLDGLSTMTKNDTLFFADDTSLYATHNKQTFLTTQTSLQKDLDNIHQYGSDWKITFNSSKTTQQTFSLKNNPHIPKLFFNGQEISVDDSHKHLGISFSGDLKFKIHINDIIKKVNKAMGPIYPIAKYLPRTTLHQIYFTYIRPYFDYCDTVYDGLITTSDALRLERLQNRAARLITGTMLRTPTDKLRRELGWTSMETRRKIHRLQLYYHIQASNPLTPHYIVSILPEKRISRTGRALRNADTLTQPHNRTSAFQKSFIPSTTKLWNSLPSLVRQSNYPTFKHALNKNFCPPRPPPFFTYGSKQGNILHTRLRVATSKLNAHLYQLQLADSPSCSCGYQFETTEHFFLHCKLHDNSRTTLFNELSNVIGTNFASLTRPLQIDTILNGDGLTGVSGREVAHCVQKFIFSSHRFR